MNDVIVIMLRKMNTSIYSSTNWEKIERTEIKWDFGKWDVDTELLGRNHESLLLLGVKSNETQCARFFFFNRGCMFSVIEESIQHFFA